jgi:hypothetical protein
LSNNLPVSFQDRVREKVRQEIGSLLSDDEYNQIVNAVYIQFVRADLPALVKDELVSHFRAQVKAELDKPEFTAGYDCQTGKTTPSEAIKALIIEVAPQAFASMFGGLLQDAVQRMRY